MTIPRIQQPRHGPGTCCIARSRLMKARYKSLEQAQRKAAQILRDSGVIVEPYECLNVPGTWHVKRAANQEAP